MKFGLLGKLVLGCFFFFFVCCLLKEKKEKKEKGAAALIIKPLWLLACLVSRKFQLVFSLSSICVFVFALFFVFLSGSFCFGGACRSSGCDSVLCLFWEEEEEEEEEVVVVVFVVGVL